jgi:endo-1,4-beta-xylanase
VGSAINDEQASGSDVQGASLAARHFNTITAENVLKWEVVHPEPGRFDFEAADRFVDFGEANDMFIIGHVLVWHSQTPDWVFEDASGAPLTRRALLDRMRDHISTVVGRYRGRISGWDVVNEALNEDGSLRQSPWLRIIGEDYIQKAFEYAREADPAAELYYNDYSIENAPKRRGTVALVTDLQEKGVPVTGIGIQAHINLEWPTLAQYDSTISAFAALGVDVLITELDIDVLPSAWGRQTADVGMTAELRAELNPYADGLPDSVQTALTLRYAGLFSTFLKHRDALSRVTFWGVSDGDSWKNDWPVPGRTNYPLLFDRQWRPKPAFAAVMAAARD